MNYEEAVAYLARYTNYERELRYPYDGWAMNLARVRLMLTHMGDPDRDLKIVHVAGTKGKGSTAAMIEAMARAAGLSTGLFTSPHLTLFRERIQISGQLISEAAVGRLVERLVPAAARVKEKPDLGELTFFEVLTALGLAAFAESKVDLAVLETGLGGRYDATTACEPLVSVLTPISLDHTDILGTTIEAIAVEKSYIIKPRKTAVIAPQPEAAAKVFRKRCREVGAPEIRVAERYSWERVEQDITGQKANFSGGRSLVNLTVPLVGEHQLVNAATALAAVDALAPAGLEVPDEAVRRGLKTVKWPGRFQRLRQNPDLILDGAHNAESAAYLRRTLADLYPDRHIIGVLSLGGDKDVEGFVRELGPALDVAIVTRAHTVKALDPGRIQAAFHGLSARLLEAAEVGEAMDQAIHIAAPADVILATGSFYLISEVLEWNRHCAA